MRNLLLAICLVALLAGCNNSNSPSQASGQPNTQQQNQQQVPRTSGY
jgi:hypothetical protein